jgi:hypothetical protein
MENVIAVHVFENGPPESHFALIFLMSVVIFV